MFQLFMDQPSAEFARCWQAAGSHIEDMADGQLRSWLRAELLPPYREHLSFRLGNQLFFIQLEDVDGQLQTPGNRPGLLALARAAGGHACVMPMRRAGRLWRPALPGWGLLDAAAGRPLHPPGLVSADDVPMSAWELHDMAVQVVRQHLEARGEEVASWVSEADVQPALWVRAADGRLGAWYSVSAVLLRAGAPAAGASRAPGNDGGLASPRRSLATIWPTLRDALAQSKEMRCTRGFHATVGLAPCLPLAPGQAADAPPLRGHPIDVRWDGRLIPVHVPGLQSGPVLSVAPNLGVNPQGRIDTVAPASGPAGAQTLH